MKNHPPASLTGRIELLDHPAQQAFLAAKRQRLPDGTRAFRRFALFAGRRGGKALALDTPIPTPSGWRTMGDLVEGDMVFDEQGRPCRVTFATDPYIPKQCYRLTFTDNATIVADADHQWLTWDKSARKATGPGRRVAHRRREKGSQQTAGPRVVTTAHIADTLMCRTESNHAIPLTGPLQYPYADLPIDPYVLGVWLGDGSSNSAMVWGIDTEIFDECARRGESVRLLRKDDLFSCPSYLVGGAPRDRDATTGRYLGTGSLCSRLRTLGVLNNKHVPLAYLHASVTQREDLLAGLMDTDGTIAADGGCEFDNTNPSLAFSVLELTRSLGFRSTLTAKRATLHGRDCGATYRVLFTPHRPVFLLPRQRDRHTFRNRFNRYRFITAVVPVASVPVKCIQVDSPSSLYLAGEAMVPTHNTKIGAIGAAEEMATPKSLGWACAPSYPELQDYVIPAVFASIPESAIDDWIASRFLLRLKNGAECGFRSLDDPERGRGPGLDWLWIDETRKVSEKAWNTILPALSDKRGVAWMTTSPNGFDWCVVSGSLITTCTGTVPIERLRVGQLVWTRQGWKPVTHVTFMGHKPTVIVEAGPQTLRCTPEHRVATSDGWCEAGALRPRASGDAPALAALTFPTLHARVRRVVGVALRAVRALKLAFHPRGTVNVFAMRHGLQVVGVDTPSVPTQVVDFKSVRNGSFRQSVGQPERPLLAIDTTDPPAAHERISRVDPRPKTRPLPNPTTVLCLTSHGFEPRQIKVEPCEVSRVSHGVILPVWDIGVKDAHEFLCDGVLVHNCYRRFWIPAVQGRPGYWAVKYRTCDNPAIDAEEIASAREELDPLFFQQEYEGEFVTFTGAIYGTLLESQILQGVEQIKAVLPEYPDIDTSRSAIVGMDPGADHPFGGCVIVATDAGLVVVGEHYARNKTVYDHVRLMREMCRGLTPDRWAIDRSQRQTAIELGQFGIYATGADNDVVSGIQRIQSWLKTRKLWFIEPWCPRMVEQLRNYQWAENIATDGSARRESVKKVMDDLPDCFVAGTRVLTRRDVAAPIETVTTNDEVWTRDGWHRVIDAFQLAEPRPTLIITTQDGRTIRSTETHKFWVVGKGWTEARNVRTYDILQTCTQTTSEADPETSGVAPTVPSRTDTTSTTWTATKQTPPSTISGVCPAPSISPCTDELVPPFVLNAPLVGNQPNATRRSLDSVLMPVNPAGDATTISTTNSASAQPATTNSPPVGSVSSSVVPGPAPETASTPGHRHHERARNVETRSSPSPRVVAQTVVTSVTIGACELVYNLSVHRCHEYYAEGILVSNSLRYAIMTWPELPSMLDRPELDATERFLRDLKDVPEDLRWQVARMRRIDYADRGEDLSELDEMLVPMDDTPQDGVGDFYA